MPPSLQFAGLTQVTQCVPGPQRQGQTGTYQLSWSAATDTSNPSSAIVYLVYISTVPGGENLSQPSWTTPAGATSFVTPELPVEVHYFIVRARDSAGHVDQNKIEREGRNSCV